MIKKSRNAARQADEATQTNLTQLLLRRVVDRA